LIHFYKRVKTKMTESDLFESTRTNIVEVLTKIPARNIFLSDFPQAYREITGSNLNPEYLGFENLESLLRVLAADLVQLDYDIHDLDITVTLKSKIYRQVTIPTQEVSMDSQVVRVVVGQIVSPSRLYIQLASEYDRLNEMMDSLDLFYARDESSSGLGLEGLDVNQGDLLAVPWTDNMWYRGKVIGVKDLITLKVFYLDYGSVADVKRSSARQLIPEFHKLPCQAILGKLWGLLPVDGQKWSGSATKRILRLTKNSHQEPLQAIVRGKEEDKLSMWLIDKNGDGINELLVEEGFAKFDYSDSHLQEVLSGERTDWNAEIHQLDTEILEFHKEVVKLCGDEDEGRIQDLTGRAHEHSRRLKVIEEAVEDSSCVVEKRSVLTDWGTAWIHLVRVNRVRWVTSFEVSSLIREWRGWDLLEKRLKTRHLKVDSLLVYRGDEIWKSLVVNEVLGLKDKQGEFKDKLSLYRLDMLPDLFNLFTTEKCKKSASSLAELLGKS